jgi:hypothetical protein
MLIHSLLYAGGFFVLEMLSFCCSCPKRYFSFIAGSARMFEAMLPLNAIMSWRICIIWSPNLESEFVTVNELHLGR